MSDPCAVNHPHVLLAFSPSAPVGQAITGDAQPTISGHTGNTAYFLLFDDEEVNGVDNESDLDPCWDQPWETLPDSPLLSPDRCISSVPQVVTSGNLTPATSLLRRLPDRTTPAEQVPRKRQVTWKVPLAASCSCCDALEFETASAIPRSVFLEWPCLASPPMIWRICRLLPYTNRQLSMVQPSQVCWSRLPRSDNVLDGTCASNCLFMSAASYLPPAPFESRSRVILDKKVLPATLTACSGRSTSNVPGLFQPRWGESLHPDPDSDLKIEDSEMWGRGCLRPILESLRFSSSASCNRTDQDGRTSQSQLLSGATSQDVSNLEFSGFSISRYRAGQGVTDTAHAQGAKLRESSNPSPVRFRSSPRAGLSVTDKAQVQGAKLRESSSPSPIRFRSLPRAEQGAIVQITQADVVRSTPGSAGASDSSGADKDQAGSVRFTQGPQTNTIGLRSGATTGVMPQASGATSSAMPQASGANVSAMPQVSGATSGELRGKQAQGTETHGQSCLKSIRFSSSSHGGQREPTGQDSAVQVTGTGGVKVGTMCVMPGSSGAREDQAGSACSVSGPIGAHKGQVGSACSEPGPPGPHEDQADSMNLMPSSTGAYKDRTGLAGSALASTGANVGLGANWDQVGSKGICQVFTSATESSGKQKSWQDTASLRGG